ncbi:MAG: MBL fold metallo-hydrolase [Patescibacteria group bacterium]
MQNNAFKKFLIVCSILVFVLGGIFLFELSRFNDEKLHVFFCDVGQGDGIYIRSPKGIDIIVDGGPDDKILSCLSNHMPFWDRTIEVVFLTHPHEDHLIGLISVLKRYSVLSFYTENISSKTPAYQELIKTLGQKKIVRKNLAAGDRILLKDGVSFLIIWPSYSFQSISTENIDIDANSFSLVELLTYKNFTTLLTGDAASFDIAHIGGVIDVLKVPHHGSKQNLDKVALQILRPKLAVISVAKNNRYGLPAKETVDLLNQLGIKTFRTDQDGEVEIVSDGQKWGFQRAK